MQKMINTNIQKHKHKTVQKYKSTKIQKYKKRYKKDEYSMGNMKL